MHCLCVCTVTADALFASSLFALPLHFPGARDQCGIGRFPRGISRPAEMCVTQIW